MQRHAPLSVRQVMVLQWIGQGCPDGVWPDFTYKTTTYALAARNLVTVDRRHGSWSAALTKVGQFYLDHGHYPMEQTPAGSPPTGDSIADIEALAAEILTELAADPRTVTVLAPTVRQRARYRRAFHHIITNQQIPAGFLLRHTGRDHGDLVIRLLPESDAPQRPPTPDVAVPAEVRAVSSEVRDLAASRAMAVSDAAMNRALRILQAIYTESVARGWNLRADPDRGSRQPGNARRRGAEHGQVPVAAGAPADAQGRVGPVDTATGPLLPLPDVGRSHPLDTGGQTRGGVRRNAESCR